MSTLYGIADFSLGALSVEAEGEADPGLEGGALIETVISRTVKQEYVPPEYECRTKLVCTPDYPPPPPADPPDDPDDPDNPYPVCMGWIRYCGFDDDGVYSCKLILVPAICL